MRAVIGIAVLDHQAFRFGTQHTSQPLRPRLSAAEVGKNRLLNDFLHEKVRASSHSLQKSEGPRQDVGPVTSVEFFDQKRRQNIAEDDMLARGLTLPRTLLRLNWDAQLRKNATEVFRELVITNHPLLQAA